MYRSIRAKNLFLNLPSTYDICSGQDRVYLFVNKAVYSTLSTVWRWRRKMVSLAKRNGFLIDNPPRSPGGQGNGIESPRSPTMTVCSCCVTLKKGLRIRRSKFCFASYCRRRINTEGKAKAAGWGKYLNAAQLLPFITKVDLKKSCWENFGRVVVWYGVRRLIIHFF